MKKLTHKELVDSIYINLDSDIPKTVIKAVLNSTAEVVKSNLVLGNAVNISKLGKFYPKQVKGRNYRNIRTSKMYTTKDHVVVKCQVSKTLKVS